jgi:hypothetical protein
LWGRNTVLAGGMAGTRKRDVYAKRLEATPVLMAQGIFRAAMNDAREALGEERVVPSGDLSL